MECYHCGSDLYIGGDHDIEDLDTGGDGILTNLSCSNEDCNTHIEIYHYFNNNEEKTKHFAEGFHSGDWESDN
jgi:hypothetical protein